MSEDTTHRLRAVKQKGLSRYHAASFEAVSLRFSGGRRTCAVRHLTRDASRRHVVQRCMDRGMGLGLCFGTLRLGADCDLCVRDIELLQMCDVIVVTVRKL